MGDGGGMAAEPLPFQQALLGVMPSDDAACSRRLTTAALFFLPLPVLKPNHDVLVTFACAWRMCVFFACLLFANSRYSRLRIYRDAGRAGAAF